MTEICDTPKWEDKWISDIIIKELGDLIPEFKMDIKIDIKKHEDKSSTFPYEWSLKSFDINGKQIESIQKFCATTEDACHELIDHIIRNYTTDPYTLKSLKRLGGFYVGGRKK